MAMLLVDRPPIVENHDAFDAIGEEPKGFTLSLNQATAVVKASNQSEAIELMAMMFAFNIVLRQRKMDGL